MSIHLRPETERLVREELTNGNFRSVDELIVQSVRAWRESHARRQPSREQRLQAISRMREFAEQNRTSLDDISIKELLHEGHRV
jgi:Arc/MetJ-type ribon-helix-helix transcriptional regulator